MQSNIKRNKLMTDNEKIKNSTWGVDHLLKPRNLKIYLSLSNYLSQKFLYYFEISFISLILVF
jgi:hypothetical protein